MGTYTIAEGSGAGGWATRLRRAAVEVAICDAVVIAGCAVLAALMGEFHRPAVGLLVLGAGGLALLFGAVSAGALPMFTATHAGSPSEMNYSNVLHAELLLQQEARDPAIAADVRHRRRIAVRLGVVGLSLVVLAFVIAA